MTSGLNVAIWPAAIMADFLSVQLLLNSDKFCNFTFNHGPSCPKPLPKSMKPRLWRHLFSRMKPIIVHKLDHPPFHSRYTHSPKEVLEYYYFCVLCAGQQNLRMTDCQMSTLFNGILADKGFAILSVSSRSTHVSPAKRDGDWHASDPPKVIPKRLKHPWMEPWMEAEMDDCLKRYERKYF